MKDNVFWKKFEKSGKISDYLEYACTMVGRDFEGRGENAVNSVKSSTRGQNGRSVYTDGDYRNAVIGDPVDDTPNIILPGYDESFKLY